MPDLDTVINLVNTGQQGGYSPENILDDEELALYREHESYIDPKLEGHYDNLAKVIPKSYLDRLAQDIFNWVRYDELSREEWSKRETEGIRLLGVSDKQIHPPAFEGASDVTHPLLAEAVIEFHARAISELFPPEGPVKATVLGEQTPELMGQAERVEQYMNYQYTEDMPGAFEEEDKLLFRLPLSGSVFKKVYYDPLIKKVVARMVEPSDFIVPYSATDLQTAGRYTHRYRKGHNWVQQHVEAGYFVEGRFQEAALNDNYDRPRVLNEIDNTEGKERTNPQEDTQHTIYETCVYLTIPGYGAVDGMGAPSKVDLPYKVWVDRDSQEVLRLQRNWRPGDDEHQAEVDIAHKKFMPGLGFYGYGLLHLLAGLGKAASGALNALMDSAAFANLQGGYRTRDAKFRGGNDGPLAPGEWRETDMSAEELSKCFFRVPYEEPSPVMFQLLGYMDERGQKFAGSNALMTGDSSLANAPVGTTLALIEQGAKTFSAIFRRLHVANKDEFRILGKLNSMYLPEEGYPYAVQGGDRTIFPYDFDDRVDIVPVSDPNIFSNTQRIVLSQGVLDLAEKNPGIINQQVAVRTMLEAMRVQNIDELLQTDPAKAQREDQLLQLQIRLQQAEVDKVNAERTEILLRGLFSAFQTAALVVQNPSIAPIADSLFQSQGGIDQNGAPLVDQSLIQQVPSPAPDIAQNTSPGFPATGNPGRLQAPEPDAMPPPSPEIGVNQGMETPRID